MIKRTLGIIGIIYQIIKRGITGEPFYLMLVLPRREQIYTEMKDVSIPIVDSAFHANLDYIAQNNLATVRLTEEEEEFVQSRANEKKN